MFRKFVIGALGAASVLFSTAAFAQGTAADAKAMLQKTVAALETDKVKTLDEINKGENGFLQGDIHPYCFNLSDGLMVAVATAKARELIGKDIRTFVDSTRYLYGVYIYRAAKEGEVTEVDYRFPAPGADQTPVLKASFVTAVAGLGCAVGYTK